MVEAVEYTNGMTVLDTILNYLMVREQSWRFLTITPRSTMTRSGSFGLVLWHINHCRLFNAKSILIHINSFLWTPAYGQAKAGRPAQTYIQQLCEDTGCNPEDQPEAMNNWEKWRERVRDIRAGGTT